LSYSIEYPTPECAKIEENIYHTNFIQLGLVKECFFIKFPVKDSVPDDGNGSKCQVIQIQENRVVNIAP
jgi:hypothetical protein